jgi:IS30 family transposase
VNESRQKMRQACRRPEVLSQGEVQHIHTLLEQGKIQKEIAELLIVSANTIRRTLAQGADIQNYKGKSVNHNPHVSSQ